MSNVLELGELSKERSGVGLANVVLESMVDVVDAFLVNRPSVSRVGLVVRSLLVVRSASITDVPMYFLLPISVDLDALRVVQATLITRWMGPCGCRRS